jgi:hypothetical protein
MNPGEVSVVFPDGRALVGRARPEGEDLWILAEDLTRLGGWSLSPEGACRGGVCVPVLPGEGGFVERRESETWVNLSQLARLVDQPVVASPRHAVWFFGDRPEELADRLGSLEAPDFTLPDLDGRPHTLGDFRGRKVLLITWASW